MGLQGDSSVGAAQPRLLLGEGRLRDRDRRVQADDHRLQRAGGRAGQLPLGGAERVLRRPDAVTSRCRGVLELLTGGRRLVPDPLVERADPRGGRRVVRIAVRAARVDAEGCERGLELADVRPGDPGPQRPVGGQVPRQHDHRSADDLERHRRRADLGTDHRHLAGDHGRAAEVPGLDPQGDRVVVPDVATDDELVRDDAALHGDGDRAGRRGRGVGRRAARRHDQPAQEDPPRRGRRRRRPPSRRWSAALR